MIHEQHDLHKKPLKNQSCYEWMLQSNKSILELLGHDYPAFVNLDCKTMMEDFKNDIENLAAYLASAGFKKGDVYTVFLPTSAHACVAFYALNKLGMVGNFVHPLTPPDGLKKILDFTKSKGIFVLDRASGFYGDILKNTHTIVCSTSDYTSGPVHDFVVADDDKNSNVPEGETIHRYRDIMAKTYDRVPTVENFGKEVAVYMHSSGTTGRSKTVQLSSFSINSCAFGQYGVDIHHDYGEAYSLCVLPCFHAFGLGTAIHLCISNAYPCIFMPKFDAEKANDYIKRYKVSYIDGVPNMFQKMFAAPNFDNEGLKNLNMVFSGGDIVSESFIEEFNAVLEKHGAAGRLYRGWGLTEMCAVCATNSSVGCKANSVGRPIDGVTACILDENRKKLPAGEEGEIALRGDTMMEGYLPDGDDFTGIWYDEDGVDWVCTGDMGKIDEDGYIFFTGRKKRIIIISGYNVYPYSMEQKLMALPYLREVCAVQGYDENAKPIVKLCVALAETDMTQDEIKTKILKFCEENLDKFSVPRKIVFLDNLPRTKMDKLDFMTMSDPVPSK